MAEMMHDYDKTRNVEIAIIIYTDFTYFFVGKLQMLYLHNTQFIFFIVCATPRGIKKTTRLPY